jgi:phosphatidylglycerophosphate synthase
MSRPPVLHVLPEPGPEVWGLDGHTRARRTAARLGLKADTSGAIRESVASGLIMRGDVLIDPLLIDRLADRPATALVLNDGGRLRVLAIHTPAGGVAQTHAILDKQTTTIRALERAGVKPATAAELAGTYDANLRKTQTPYAVDLAQTGTAEAERRTFKAVYKGVTDFVTKFIWPPVALPITQICARAHIHPNWVTLVSLVFVLAALWCFWHGWFFAGFAAGWLAALADTVDGKLARVTLTSSKWGNVFDHGIDLVHPPFWWLAFWHGLGVSTGYWPDAVMYIAVGGYVAGKLMEQAFISLIGFKVHIWQRLDSTFRLITARRNPNLAILTVFGTFGAYQTGYWLLAAWTVFCFGFHGVRLVIALDNKRRGATLTSWLEG